MSASTDRTRYDDPLAVDGALLDRITRAQRDFILEGDAREVFARLLEDVLTITGSSYGFIGEIETTAAGARQLRTWAITNVAWNDELRTWFEEESPTGLEFANLDTLFGAVIRTGRPVLSNRPSSDPRAGGLPDGHPPLDAFAGLPFRSGTEVLGMVGLANRPGGYDEWLVERLDPFLTTCAALIAAMRSRRRRELAERRLQESEARVRMYADTIEATPDFVGVATPDGRILEVNRAGRRMVGFPVDGSLEDLAVGDIHPPWSREVVRSEGLPTALREGHWSGETAFIAADGREVPMSQVIVVSKDALGVPLRVSTIARDITESKEIARLKSEFVSTVSHELRTPLTSIRAALSLLDAGALGVLPAQVEDVVSLARGNTERLIRLVDDILDFERVQSAKLNVDLANVDPLTIAAAACDAVRAAATEAHVTLDLLTTGTAVRKARVEADSDRIVQVLVNLLANAVKFSPPAARVELTLSCSGGEVEFIVDDEGPGIPPGQLERIFEPFQQADASDRRPVGGTGLGLAIARSITDSHGGSILAENLDRGGARFRLRLPQAGSTESNPRRT